MYIVLLTLLSMYKHIAAITIVYSNNLQFTLQTDFSQSQIFTRKIKISNICVKYIGRSFINLFVRIVHCTLNEKYAIMRNMIIFKRIFTNSSEKCKVKLIFTLQFTIIFYFIHLFIFGFF